MALCDWSSDVCSSDLAMQLAQPAQQQAPAQAQQQAQQPVQQQAQQPAQVAATHVGNGAFKGSAPPMFKGERSESTKFLMAFRIFHVANRTNETLINPVTRIATALTYIDGPLIDPWKEDQMWKLEDRLAAGVADTSEDHWTTFLTVTHGLCVGVITDTLVITELRGVRVVQIP